MSRRFDGAGRRAALDALARDGADLLVIGGGITGAGIARDAALRGLHVGLVERDDFASGTSSRSSRLVHGGLRYLEHGQIHLVFESCRERRILLRTAPHLVRPLRFLWPVFDGARLPMWKLRAGLFAYDALALFRNVAPHRHLPRSGVLAAEPALAAEHLRGGAIYYDASTDDARLTLATVRAAHDAGALTANHAPVIGLTTDGGRVTGARVSDAVDGRERVVRARIVINATGPWSDDVRRMADPSAAASVRGTRGAHVLVPRDRVCNHDALTLLSPIDGRIFFVLPAGAFSLISTTDTDDRGRPEDVHASPDDVAYLLRSANAYFPAAKLTAGDVVAAWAGVRPLAGGDPRAADVVSREHVVARSAPGLLSITGGKLTTYRVMARDAVDAALRELGVRARPVRTDRMPLPGGAMTSLTGEADAAGAACGSGELARHLVGRYGTEWRDVWAIAASDPALRERVAPPLPYLAAELVWAARHEMALTLDDVLVRRLHIAFETSDHGTAVAPRAARTIAPLVGWDADATARALRAYEEAVTHMFGVHGD